MKPLVKFLFTMVKTYAFWVVFCIVCIHGFNAPHSERYMYSQNGVGYLRGHIDEDMLRMIIGDDVGIIIIDSPGGNMVAALNIAMQVTRRDITVIVGSNSQCSSACILIHQASPNRFASDDAVFGFHSPSIVGELNHKEYEIEIAKARIIMSEVLQAAGMSADFIDSWIYETEVDFYSAKELYDLGYIDELIDNTYKPVSSKLKKDKSLSI